MLCLHLNNFIEMKLFFFTSANIVVYRAQLISTFHAATPAKQPPDNWIHVHVSSFDNPDMMQKKLQAAGALGMLLGTIVYRRKS